LNKFPKKIKYLKTHLVTGGSGKQTIDRPTGNPSPQLTVAEDYFG
jgi:hypothetical protein